MRVEFFLTLGLVGGVEYSLLGKVLEGIHGSFVGGTAPITINSGSVLNDSPVNIRRISIKDLRYYANVAGASICGDASLVNFRCEPYCHDIINGTRTTEPTKRVRMVEIMREYVTGTKGYIAVIDSRREIILSFSGERSQSTRLSLSLPAPIPLNIDYPGNNNRNIRINAVAVQATLYESAVRMFEQYRDVLRDLAYDEKTRDYKVVFMGHSVGAQISAFSMIISHHELGIPWRRIRYVGYGMTRIGNREFVRWFNQQDLDATHVINYDEKLVQFYRLIYNYQYIGNEVFINKDGSIRICDNAYFEDPDCNLGELDGQFRGPHVHAFKTEFGIDC